MINPRIRCRNFIKNYGSEYSSFSG